MGGGQSTPTTTQNNGVHIVTNTGASSTNTYSNISSNGGNITSGSSATGATVGVKAGVTVTPVPELQNLWSVLSGDTV